MAMRTFIALPVPEAVKIRLVGLQQEWRPVAPGGGIRWVRPEQMHLTLSFLGEVDAGRQGDLIQAVRSACQGFCSFPLEAYGTGFFPDSRRPRVLWVGLRGETDQLGRLEQSVAKTVASFAEKEENRAFSPHLTLARIKSLSAAETRRLAAEVADRSACGLGGWRADRVEIICSELRPEGSRYTCLGSIGLGSGDSLAAETGSHQDGF